MSSPYVGNPLYPQPIAYGGSYQEGSLASNPTVAPIDLTVQGSDWLWAVFAVMFSTGLGVTAWSYMRPTGARAFHNVSIVVLMTASVAYFCMASDLGAVPIAVEFVRQKSVLYTGDAATVYRSIWYVRYVDWAITTPALLLTLLLSTGLPVSDIIITIFWDEVMIITGLVGALVHSQYKWGFYVFGCVAMFMVFYTLIFSARKAALAIGEDVHKAYIRSALTLSFLWFLYPVAWGLCDGGNVISTDSEMIFYGILDLLAKPGYTILHLLAIKNIDYSRWQFASGHYSVGNQVANNSLNEKAPRHSTETTATRVGEPAQANKAVSGPTAGQTV